MKLTAGKKVFIKLYGDVEFDLDQTAPSMLNANIEYKTELAYFQYWGQETTVTDYDGRLIVQTNTVAVLVKEGGDVVSVYPSVLLVPMDEE